MRVYNHATKDMQNELGQLFEKTFYSQNEQSVDEVLYCKSLSKDQITGLINQFDSTLDQTISAHDLTLLLTAPQPSKEEFKKGITDAIEKDPELREMLMAMLMKQPMQIKQKE